MKIANFYVVGGPISVGKSSLVNLLPYESVPELEEKNRLETIMLESTYNKKRVKPELIEFYFLEKRKERYEKFSSAKNTYVLDRSIFETLWFAKENIPKKSVKHFEKLFDGTINELIERNGKPKIYFLLDLNWKKFHERIFKRRRTEETSHFEKNIDFFKKHIKEYSSHMKIILKKYKIDFFVINTNNLTSKQVAKVVLDKIKSVKNEK